MLQINYEYRLLRLNKLIQKEDGRFENFKLLIVQKDKNGKINKWYECPEDILGKYEYRELKKLGHKVLEAYEKPMLKLREGELIEIPFLRHTFVDGRR